MSNNAPKAAPTALVDTRIKIQDKHGNVDKPNEHVSKANGQVTWESDGDEFWIFFGTPQGSSTHEPKSPFKSGYVFYVPPYGAISTGPVDPGATVSNKGYKYTVVGPDGITDPIIIIDK